MPDSPITTLVTPERLERRHEPVAPRRRFLRRVSRAFVVAGIIIALSLVAGMMGFAFFERMDAVDAFVNAAMLLSGMGPMKTEGLSTGGKIFAGLYALYSGLIMIVTTGVMLAPIAHRVLHLFHSEE